MNNTAKAVTFIVTICAMFGIVSTSLTQADPPGGGSPPGFCDNIVDCIVDDPFVQDAIEFATHERYTDEEAVAAMDDEANDNSLNHQRYTDDEARDAVGPVGLTGYEIVPDDFNITLGFGEVATFQVNCPRGKVVLGGGASQTGPDGPSGLVPMVSSSPVLADNGWSAQWVNISVNSSEIDVTVFAICACENSEANRN